MTRYMSHKHGAILDQRRLDRMRRFQDEYGRPMTASELAHVCGWSTGGAENFLRRMKREGFLNEEGRCLTQP